MQIQGEQIMRSTINKTLKKTPSFSTKEHSKHALTTRKKAGQEKDFGKISAQLLRDALNAEAPLEVLARLTEALRQKFGLVNCGLFLARPDEGYLHQDTLAGTSIWSHEVGKPWALERGVVGRCFRKAKPQFVPDVKLDPDYVLADNSVVCEYAIPLVFRKKVLGVLNIESSNRRFLTEKRKEGLQELAHQIVGVIHLAHLGNRLTETTLALEIANSELKKATRRLKKMSLTDALTKIYNRRYFDDVIEKAFLRSTRQPELFSVVAIDIDHFKAYNDTYGHAAGDRILKTVATQMKLALLRKTDFLARHGGEEFIALLYADDENGALGVAERVVKSIAALKIPHQKSNYGVLTVSAGVASSKKHQTALSLMKSADEALYRAKQHGRNRAEK
jgi:diguanylate cyclase (GGDEF)-like protein